MLLYSAVLCNYQYIQLVPTEIKPMGFIGIIGNVSSLEQLKLSRARFW